MIFTLASVCRWYLRQPLIIIICSARVFWALNMNLNFMLIHFTARSHRQFNSGYMENSGAHCSTMEFIVQVL